MDIRFSTRLARRRASGASSRVPVCLFSSSCRALQHGGECLSLSRFVIFYFLFFFSSSFVPNRIKLNISPFYQETLGSIFGCQGLQCYGPRNGRGNSRVCDEFYDESSGCGKNKVGPTFSPGRKASSDHIANIRLQTSVTKTTALRVTMDLIKNGGFFAFFRGVVPRMSGQIPRSAWGMIVYQGIMSVSQKEPESEPPAAKTTPTSPLVTVPVAATIPPRPPGTPSLHKQTENK